MLQLCCINKYLKKLKPGYLTASNDNVVRHESCHVEQAAIDMVQSVIHGLKYNFIFNHLTNQLTNTEKVFQYV